MKKSFCALLAVLLLSSNCVDGMRWWPRKKVTQEEAIRQLEEYARKQQEMEGIVEEEGGTEIEKEGEEEGEVAQPTMEQEEEKEKGEKKPMFFLRLLGRNFPVAPFVMNQFPVFWAQSRVEMGKKIQERRIEKEEKGIRKSVPMEKEIMEAQARFEPVGTEEDPWDVTDLLEPLGIDDQNVQFELFDVFLKVVEDKIKPADAGPAATLFFLIRIANLLGNEEVQKKCTQAFMQKIILPRMYPMKSKKPGIYPLDEHFFLFRESLDVLYLCDERMEQNPVVKTFKKRSAFFKVLPLNKKEFVSGSMYNLYLWDIKQVDTPVGKSERFRAPAFVMSGHNFEPIVIPGRNQFITLNLENSRSGFSVWDKEFEHEEILTSFWSAPIALLPQQNQLLMLNFLEHSKSNEIWLVDMFKKQKRVRKKFKSPDLLKILNPIVIPDTNFFLAMSTNDIKLWDLKNSNPIAEFKVKEPMEIIVLNKKSFCSRSKNSSDVLIWELDKPKPIQKIVHKAPVQAMALMLGGQLLTYAGGKVYVWDLLTQQNFTLHQVDLCFRVFVQGKEVDLSDGSDDYEIFMSMPRAMQRAIKRKLAKKKIEMEQLIEEV